MRCSSSRMAAWLVRKWVNLYTIGLPIDVKKFRGEEIASDLWEQAQDASGSVSGRRSLRVHILGRLLFGIPDDLFWRMEHSKTTGGSIAMNRARYLTYPRTYINLIVLLVGMVVLFPIGVGGFVTAIVAAVVPPVLFATVFMYKWTTVAIGPIPIDTFPEALVVSLLGLVLLLIELFVANAIVSILRRHVSVRIARFHFGQDA